MRGLPFNVPIKIGGIPTPEIREEFRILNPVQFTRIGETLTFEQGQDDLERLLKAADIPLKIKAIGAMLGREITRTQAEDETAVTQGDHIIRGPCEQGWIAEGRVRDQGPDLNRGRLQRKGRRQTSSTPHCPPLMPSHSAGNSIPTARKSA